MRPAFKEALRELLAREETPFYAYDLAGIEHQAKRLKDAFPEVRFFYAIKANPNPAILALLREQGFGAETVSLGEALKAYQSGFLPAEVVLNGPVKPPGWLKELKAEGVPTLVLDSEADARRVAEYLPGAEVLIRVNPALAVHTHPHLATGKGESQFGVLPEALERVLEVARAGGLKVRGLHLHLGSSLNSPEDFAAGWGLLAELLREFGPFAVADLGGGFGLGLKPQALRPLVRPFFDLVEEVWMEPGRFLVAEAGVLVARAWGVKETKRRYLLLDAGMTLFIRPMLYGVNPMVQPLYESPETGVFDLVGPACESTDVLKRDARLPVPKEGDALAILEAGAYGASMASRYLQTPPPKEFLFDGTNWQRVDG